MADWKKVNGGRVREGAMASDDSYGFNGSFRFLINGVRIKVIASDGMGWQHVSVSINNSTFTPSWQIMCIVKDLFWEPEDTVIQYHPAASQYINCHPGCLHLWRPLNEKLPIPPMEFVGPKT